MEESDKLPLKRVELSLSKFNEVAIPHHLDLLRQHKANIIKYSAAGELTRVRAEQMRARRACSALRALLGELHALRSRVLDEHLARFDQLTQRSRDLTLKAVVDYLESAPQAARRAAAEQALAGSAASTDSVGVLARDPPAAPLQLLIDENEVAEAALREREAVLAGWAALQADVRAVHDAWQHVQAAALAHRELVSTSATLVDATADNVEHARRNLSVAEKLRVGAWGCSGAALGALAGGPLGLLAGAKAGVAAALMGSALGLGAARALARRRQRDVDRETEHDDRERKDQ